MCPCGEENPQRTIHEDFWLSHAVIYSPRLAADPSERHQGGGGGGGGRTEVVQIKDRLRPPGEAIGDEQLIKESSRALMPEVRPGDL